MTNKERLISLLGFAPDNNALEGALLDAGVTGSSTYDGTNIVSLKTIAIGLMELLLTTADTSFFNGVTTAGIRYDRASILKRMAMLKAEIGLLDVTGPIITSKSVW